MFGRPYVVAIFVIAWFLICPALSQEQEILQGQAGLYPLRAYLSQPAQVGPARLVVELGEPKELFKLPEGRHRPAAGEPTPTPEPPRELAVSVVMEMPEMASMRPSSLKLKAVTPQRFEGDVLITMKGEWRVQFVVDTPQGEFRPLARFRVGPSPPSKGSGDGGLELCDPDASDVIPLKVRSLPEPARVGQNRIRVELPTDVSVPVMLGVGMPGLALGLPPVEALRQDDGSYEAVVDLPMAGYWQLRVDLNGRTLPPFALTVEETRTHGPSRTLLPWLALALVLLAVVLLWRRPKTSKSWILASLLLLGTLALGAWIEAFWPPSHASSMEMDMFRFDMGMGHLTAPLPVLEAKLEKTRLASTRDYGATVSFRQTTMLVAPANGVVDRLATEGTVVRAGDLVAQVGSQGVKAKALGVVVETLTSQGASVEQGSPLLRLADPKTVVVRALAPLSDHGTLRPGMKVSVVSQEGQRSQGTLTLVSALIQPRGIPIEASVDNRRPKGAPSHQSGETSQPDLGQFVFGQNVTLKVELEEPRLTLSVPREAIRETSDGQAQVFLVNQIAGQRVAKAQKVSLGVTTETHAEVLRGLSAGQTIVAKLEPSLSDGDVVVRATLGEGVFRSLAVPGEGSH